MAQGSMYDKYNVHSRVGVRTRIVATTHAHELKIFALTDPRVACGALLVDRTTGDPTFRCVTDADYGADSQDAGEAADAIGRSDALEAALRWGLPRSLIERARRIVGPAAEALKTLDELSASLANQLAAARVERQLMVAALARAREAERCATVALADAQAGVERLALAEVAFARREAAQAQAAAVFADYAIEASAPEQLGGALNSLSLVEGSGGNAQLESPVGVVASSLASAQRLRVKRLKEMGLRPLSAAELRGASRQAAGADTGAAFAPSVASTLGTARTSVANTPVQVVSEQSEWNGWTGRLISVDSDAAILQVESAGALRAKVQVCIIPPPPRSRLAASVLSAPSFAASAAVPSTFAASVISAFAPVVTATTTSVISASTIAAAAAATVVADTNNVEEDEEEEDGYGGESGEGEGSFGGVYEVIEFFVDELGTWDVYGGQGVIISDSRTAGQTALIPGRGGGSAVDEDFNYGVARPTAAEAWARLVAEAKATAPPLKSTVAAPLSRRAAAAKLKRNAGRGRPIT
mmetsp:Transcript_39113/g.90612  ORF Transcript_39113/g.90612 Transcript_39113/m.90612 type:complete len:528 (+) Transcript_39113:99-1682(+)